jgi:hypothetical protein
LRQAKVRGRKARRLWFLLHILGRCGRSSQGRRARRGESDQSGHVPNSPNALTSEHRTVPADQTIRGIGESKGFPKFIIKEMEIATRNLCETTLRDAVSLSK